MAIIRMPIGYRFLPTDEELINDYLFNKVNRKTVPAPIIQDITANVLYNFHPSALVGDAEENEKYFFMYGYKFMENKKFKTKVGSWMCNGDEQPIYSSSSKCIGFKMEFTYYEGNYDRTTWEMVHYRLHDERKPYEETCTLGKIWNAGTKKFYEDEFCEDKFHDFEFHEVEFYEDDKLVSIL